MTAAAPRARLRLRWPRRRIVVAGVATVTFALAVGVPTGVVPTPLYTRMTPVLWWNYPVWAATAVLGGLVVATYIRRPGDRAPRNGVPAASGGGLLAAFAVGCPVWALRSRLRSENACAFGTGRPSPTPRHPSEEHQPL